jgi:hypothetical protein
MFTENGARYGPGQQTYVTAEALAVVELVVKLVFGFVGNSDAFAQAVGGYYSGADPKPDEPFRWDCGCLCGSQRTGSQE